MNISKKLQIIQRLSGLTQEKLAQRLGVSFVTLNSWLNKKSLPHKQKQERVDELYLRYIGEALVPKDVLLAKQNILLKKSSAYKNVSR